MEKNFKSSSFKARYTAWRAGAVQFLRAKGIYVVLTACIAAVGIAAAILLLTPKEESKLQQAEQNTPVSISGDETLAQAQRTPMPVQTPVNTAAPAITETPQATPIPEFTAAPSASPTPKEQKTKAIAPVDGEIIWNYAVTELIYSETLAQWMTHAGVDIAAKQGEEVHAVLGGTIDKIYEDEAFGQTVVISHANRQASVYANLKADVPVKEGQKVNAGDTIGTVGDTAVSECGIKSHLHFEFLQDGKNVDPAEYVLFQKSN